MSAAPVPPPSSDGPPPSIESVLAAIQSLYRHPDPREKEAASAWLQQMQKSVHAWKVSDDLLHRKMDVESCYIAAQTMRTKIQHSFHELPEDSHESLKNSLLEHFALLNESSPSIISTQLCLALADLMLQMSVWQNSVTDIVNLAANSNPFALLEILIVLPEEVNSRQLRLGMNRREQVLDNLRRSFPIANEFLQMCLREKAPTNSQYNINCLRCLRSWLQVGVVPLQDIERNQVMCYAFQTLQDLTSTPELHEAATDCVCSLIEQLESSPSSVTPPAAGAGINSEAEAAAASYALEYNIYNVVKNLEPAYERCVSSEDLVKALNLCRVFTELGESMLLKLVYTFTSSGQAHFSIGIFDSVLLCCSHPDYEIPDITFNLWYRLSEEIYQTNNEALTQLFKVHVEKLIGALCRHCQQEPDNEGLLEEKDDFGEFRSRVNELIKDVAFVVGSENIFQHMFEYLKTTSANWEMTEAALFVMTAVARNLLPTDTKFAPQVVESVLSVPEHAHIAIRYMSIKLIGEMADWIGEHPDYLERILNWLMTGLQHAKLVNVAALALQSICTGCRRGMIPHFAGLVEVLKNMDTYQAKPDAVNGLIKGVSQILVNMPHDQVHLSLKTLCWLQVVPLNAILDYTKANAAPISKNSSRDPVIYLDRLASIFRNTHVNVASDMPHPCLPVAQELWPVLSRTVDLCQADLRVMERCCRTIRFVVRCVDQHGTPLLEPIVDQIVRLYQAHPHSCFLYLASVLVDEFSHNSAFVRGLLGMLEALWPVTLRLLGGQDDSAKVNNPDTIDDFFRLNVRFLQHSPVPYLQIPIVQQLDIVNCGLDSIKINHREASASVMKFFFDLAHASRSKTHKEDYEVRKQLALDLVGKCGAQLVHRVVYAAVFCLASFALTDIGELLHELMLIGRERVCEWLAESLKTFPETKVTKKQLVKFHTAVTSAENSQQATDALRDFCRLWR